MNTDKAPGAKLPAEIAIEPEMPICDPHHHFWYDTGRDYTIEDFLMDISGGHNIIKTVYLESWHMFKKNEGQENQPAVETKFIHNAVLHHQNIKTDIAAGIVGFADLTIGSAVASTLDAHLAAGKETFRGIRQLTVWDASPEVNPHNNPKGIMLEKKFREGFKCLQQYGLSYDTWLFHTQLNELIDLAQQFPDTPIIVNHFGGPIGIGPYAEKRQEVFKEWQRSITQLAECQNIYMKLGGLGMSLFGFNWQNVKIPPSSSELAAALMPYCNWCIEKIGVDRCMFESNFPPDKRSYSYTTLWNAFKLVSKKLSNTERNALFCDTAVKAYRLK